MFFKISKNIENKVFREYTGIEFGKQQPTTESENYV